MKSVCVLGFILVLGFGVTRSEVEGIQGAGPQIVFCGGWSPESPTMVIILSLPLHAVPPFIIN